MLVIQVGWTKAKVAVFDPKTNALTTYGWIELESIKGLTLHKYDWNKR